MFKNGLVVFVGLAITKLLNLFCHIWITNHSSPDVYGVFSIAFVLVMFASNLCCLGLNQSLIKYLSSEGINYVLKWSVLKVVRFSFFYTILTSLLCVLILTLLSDWLSSFHDESRLRSTLIMAAMALPFMGILILSTYLFRSQHVFWPEVLMRNFLRSLFFLLGLVVLSSLGLINQPFWIASVFFLSFLLTAIFAACLPFYVFKIDSDQDHSKSFNQKSVIQYGLLTLVSLFFYEGLIATDKIILGYFATSEELGLYSGASMLARQSEVAGIVIFTILSPKLASKVNLKDSIHSGVMSTTLVSVVFGIFGMILLFFIRDYVLMIFGTEYVAMNREFIVICGGFLMLIITTPFSAALQFGNKITYDNGILVFGFIFNLLASYFCIKNWGSMGAAIGTGISLSLVSILRILIYSIKMGKVKA
tara:strand:- start:14331 stop:15590 length:1260 start_codon:yes stop_codon:yes gene_type:complete